MVTINSKRAARSPRYQPLIQDGGLEPEMATKFIEFKALNHEMWENNLQTNHMFIGLKAPYDSVEKK